MKSLNRPSLAVVALLFAAGARNTSAQVENTIAFTTSFPFTVGNAIAPAGSYTITPADDDPRVFELWGPGRRSSSSPRPLSRSKAGRETKSCSAATATGTC